MIKEITDINSVGTGNVLLDFYSPTCMPCRTLNPFLEEISKEFQNLTVAKIEVTQSPDISQMFGVTTVPTVIFMKNNKVREVIRGLTSKENLKSMVRKCSGE